MSAPNRWKGAVLQVARQRGGLDAMVLRSCAERVQTEEGFRVALAAVGYDTVDRDWLERIQERVAQDALAPSPQGKAGEPA